MFGIGVPELVIIALVAIIFIRPEDLPAFFRAAGRLYAQAKKAYDDVASIKDEFVRVVNETMEEEGDKASSPASSASLLPAPPAIEDEHRVASDSAEPESTGEKS